MAHAPAGGERGDELEAAPVLVVRVGATRAGCVGVSAVDLDYHGAGFTSDAHQVDASGVLFGVGGEFANQ
ncbi:hypothetical protein TH66_14205 [Carbonactinospora thermoautotrophica]|uniref:Uncharacterized protein n=1 Tax=Carbonactinospora thermoautotrophica TaxID=1469144 RepID=A0A132NHE6_9ACTN|nr:hypothetical protein TH66_14205 [Carbonactinospora thermoautotrophica]KWX09132.1 hypothetical protein TR74_11465 [Carbonactinospora thermoautotrophica]